jgi:hypothetical protein
MQLLSLSLLHCVAWGGTATPVTWSSSYQHSKLLFL